MLDGRSISSIRLIIIPVRLELLGWGEGVCVGGYPRFWRWGEQQRKMLLMHDHHGDGCLEERLCWSRTNANAAS